ncbi:polymer-forming cytoskeletal protein [Altererythrobacter soli]|uniref:Polymer-forming cytoskeletal protein n=1 Tax=Croceibacterium soli TaxID=1739690 RepID=A0A6I4UN65_9SPHN|nr:polymer-forming cytoskeletal protein [Croceibacterium soli]MXP40158.1 polymer-forming cytoskeletal protein [Croceibacterium soli]
MFSKKPEQRPASGTPRIVANNGSTFSVIGTDVTITGDISAAADLHVDGTVVGDIACASLVQGESSRIEGAIVAETARLAGAVKGTITVRSLVILKSARIEGDVHYDALTIEQGAAVDGRFAHDAGGSAASPEEPKSEDEPRLTLAS